MESFVAIDKTYDNIEIDTTEKLNKISEENKPVTNCEQSSGDVINETLANPDTKDDSAKTNHEVENKTNGDESYTNSTLNQLQKHKPRKRIAISESDSDTEGNVQIVDDNIESENITTSQNSDNDNVPEVAKIKYRKHVSMLQSDSEEEKGVPSSQMKKEASSNQKTVNSFDSNSDGEDNVISSRNITRKKAALLNSDSDDEALKPSSDIESLRSRKSANTSSSESDNEELKVNLSRKSASGKLKHKKIVPGYSDTENEIIAPHNKSFSDNNQQEMPIYTNDLEEEKPTKSSRWSALCDSESSGDEVNHSDGNKSVGEKSSMSEEEVSKPVSYRRKPQPKKEKGPKKMTGKEAADQRREIRSESQRMTRESCISLPYHRPKSHSLREFLARRPKLASAVPLVAKTPPSVAIKMSMEQLEVISKKFEERHKEVEKFYKSDSEPEDDDEEKDDADYVPEIECSSTVDNSKDENLANTNSILEGILTDKEVEDLSSQTFNEKEGLTINDKKDNDNAELMEVDDIDGNIQRAVSDCILRLLSQVEHVDKGEDTFDKGVDIPEAANLKNFDDITNNSISVEENVENSETQSHNKSVELEQQLAEYEFNLDDMDERSERIINSVNQTELEHQKDESMDELKEPSSENQQQIIDFSELDKEIENFTRDSPPEREKPKLSKMELLKERLSNIQPRLSSSANNIIDLDNIAKPTQVVQLMERFAKHTAKKEHHKDKIKLNIISVESGGEIHKETLAVHVDDEEDTTVEEKPGVRLQRLRNELQTQIAQQKQQLWENKTKKEVKNVVDDDDPYKDEKSECGADDDILDYDEEEEMTESSENEDYDDEEEEIEDATADKPKKKSAFVDDEAMESDIEENEEQVESENEDQEADDNVEADNEEDSFDEDNNIEEFNKTDENKENELKDKDEKDGTTAFKKPLRRIIKGFTEDSDDDEDVQLSSVVSKIAEKLNRSNEDGNSTTQDDYITSYQLQNQRTPVRSNSDLKFLTPVSYITGLQNLTNSSSKVQSPTNVPSPLREANWHATLQKKLFADSVITNSQAEAMAQLCSEGFQDSQASTQDNLTTNLSTEHSSSTKIPSTASRDLNCSVDFEEAPSTQDLLNICSGEFTGISQIISSNEVSKTCVNHTLNPVEEVKTLGEDQDMVISQLLNEEEMEAFKKKFDSPILIHSQKVIKEAEEVAGTGGVIDSDDDEGVLEVKKRKNQKKLTFSDDESSDEEEEEEEPEEEIDLHDEDQLDDETAAEDVNYDSEENEIEYADDKDENLKVNDFFEDEAELSESEWGSADEDEQDLDTLDFEKGDEEKFDEKQIRTDLERIHMRRMLDDDTREVKLLQEMLLDDGELHGSGRERQFKWKNIDSQGAVDDTRKNSDDEIGFDEDESEEQWRRKRHEREMFLKEKEPDDSELLSKSEILKFGHKVVQRSSSNSQGSMLMEKSKVEIGSPSLKSTLGLLHKRGSFLSRGDQVLQKLAEYNKLSATTTTVAQKTKNSKSFLFQTVEVKAVNEKLSIFSKKRKALEGTPKVIKKLRLTDNLSPAVKKKKSNSNVKSKLFGVT